MANKYLWERFDFQFMISLTVLHLLFSSLVVRGMGYYGFYSHPKVSMWTTAPLACLSVGSITFMNLNLGHNSVGFYQMSKIMCIPATLVMQYSLFGVSVSFRMLMALTVLMFGVGVATVTDVQLNVIGSIYALIAIGITVSSQIMTNYMQSSLKLDHMQLLGNVLPVMAFLALLAVPLFEDPQVLIMVDWPPMCYFYIILSCCFACLVNISNYLVIGQTSPVTYQVVGHFKTITIIALGFWLFAYQLVPRNLIGIAFALAGVVLYSEMKRRDNAK
eukprot:CAMPEP_0119125872 /NCGR_PEP_ID=MMETSP1310-20130426/5000_1 /TAXON_ID=464262 /ORGANISM="Genus nov. species nov., Strain RCC2339" /LENGTH=274 /DNA_ID=CAMNT_0007115985 /DNA_START=206 /DNA_END=1030 /DNA_ORIENTATION=-